MAHVDFNQKSRLKEIHVREPVSDDELHTLIEAFKILLKLDIREREKTQKDVQQDSNSISISALNDKK